jgi:hypothetical protein
MPTDNELPPPASRIPGPLVVGVCAVIALLVVALVAPAILQAREAARRTQSRNSLLQIGLALQNYHDTFTVFPPGGVFNEDGVAFHEWTTMIGPFLEVSPWYFVSNFHIPWDDPRVVDWFRSHNYPRYFVNPSLPSPIRPDGLVENHYAASQSILYRNSSVSIRDLKTGTTSRLMVADAFDKFLPVGCPYGWRDARLGLGKHPDGFGCKVRDVTQCLMADGRVITVSADVDHRVLQELAGPPESQPNSRSVERITEYPLLDTSKIWKNELYFPDPEFPKVVGIHRTSPDGKTVLNLAMERVPGTQISDVGSNQ